MNQLRPYNSEFNNATKTIHALPWQQQQIITRYANSLPKAVRDSYIADVLARLRPYAGIAAVEQACATTTVYGGSQETKQ